MNANTYTHTYIVIISYITVLYTYIHTYIHAYIRTELLASLRFSPEDGWLKVLYHFRVNTYTHTYIVIMSYTHSGIHIQTHIHTYRASCLSALLA